MIADRLIADGAMEIGGRLPVNTHGGQLGQAYIQGMNGIAEGVRQLRGTSVNPVLDGGHVRVTAGTADLPPSRSQNLDEAHRLIEYSQARSAYTLGNRALLAKFRHRS